MNAEGQGGSWPQTARKSISQAPFTSLVLATNAVIFVLLELTGGSGSVLNLYRWYAKFGPAIQDGDWLRLVAPIFLHSGVFHLLLNSAALLIFGPRLEQAFGTLAFASIYLISGIFGVAASYLISPHIGVGASGAIFGIIGAYAVYLYINRELMGEEARQMLMSLLVLIGLNVLMGFVIPRIDQAAHIGGLVAGACMAAAVAPVMGISMPGSVFLFYRGHASMTIKRKSVPRILLSASAGLMLAIAITTFVSLTVEYDPETLQIYRLYEFIKPR